MLDSAEQLIDEWIKESFLTEDITGKEKFISINSIREIPYIEFPNFTSDENDAVYRMAREVLLYSRENNNCNEVAITYDMTSKTEAGNVGYILVPGDEFSVKFADDQRVRALMASTKDLAIVNLHNHPRGAGFSFQDLSIFAFSDNIRLMAILDNTGKMSTLFRCAAVDMKPMMREAISEVIPDFSERIRNNPNISVNDIVTADEKRDILQYALPQIEKYGVIFTDWADRSRAKEISQFLSERYKRIISWQDPWDVKKTLRKAIQLFAYRGEGEHERWSQARKQIDNVIKTYRDYGLSDAEIKTIIKEEDSDNVLAEKFVMKLLAEERLRGR